MNIVNQREMAIAQARCETRDYLIATYRYNTVAECAHAEAVLVHPLIIDLIDIEVPVKTAVEFAFDWLSEHDAAHEEALAIDAEQYANHYTYVKPHATSLVFKTDGRKVWWWSFNRGVWFPDFNVSPSTVHNHVTSGNGNYCSNPAP